MYVVLAQKKRADVIKKRVYGRIVECLESDIISPIFSYFRCKTELKRLRLVREKNIVSTDNETDGTLEFAVMDRISVTEE